MGANLPDLPNFGLHREPVSCCYKGRGGKERGGGGGEEAKGSLWVPYPGQIDRFSDP